MCTPNTAGRHNDLEQMRRSVATCRVHTAQQPAHANFHNLASRGVRMSETCIRGYLLILKTARPINPQSAHLAASCKRCVLVPVWRKAVLDVQASDTRSTWTASDRLQADVASACMLRFMCIYIASSHLVADLVTCYIGISVSSIVTKAIINCFAIAARLLNQWLVKQVLLYGLVCFNSVCLSAQMAKYVRPTFNLFCRLC